MNAPVQIWIAAGQPQQRRAPLLLVWLRGGGKGRGRRPKGRLIASRQPPFSEATTMSPRGACRVTAMPAAISPRPGSDLRIRSQLLVGSSLAPRGPIDCHTCPQLLGPCSITMCSDRRRLRRPTKHPKNTPTIEVSDKQCVLGSSPPSLPCSPEESTPKPGPPGPTHRRRPVQNAPLKQTDGSAARSLVTRRCTHRPSQRRAALRDSRTTRLVRPGSNPWRETG